MMSNWQQIRQQISIAIAIVAVVTAASFMTIQAQPQQQPQQPLAPSQGGGTGTTTILRDIFPKGYDDGLRDGKKDIGNGTAYQGKCPQTILQFPTYCTGYYIGYDTGYKRQENNATAAAEALKTMQSLPESLR
jgi:hypothetical protein